MQWSPQVSPDCYQRFRRALERALTEESDVHLGHEHLLEHVLPLDEPPDAADMLLCSTDSGIACMDSSCELGAAAPSKDDK